MRSILIQLRPRLQAVRVVYQKFSLGSLTLIRDSFMTLKIDDRNYILTFFKFDSFLIKKWHSKNNRNRLFCREKDSLSVETFRVSNRQTTGGKSQNTPGLEKSTFRPGSENSKK